MCRCGVWLDFGHVQTYYQSRTYLSTQRAFNHLIFVNNTVMKASDKEDLISAEGSWYEKLPIPLKKYTPTFLGWSEWNGKLAYVLEQECLPTLSDLFVFGNLDLNSWQRIFEATRKTVEDFRRFEAGEDKNIDIKVLFYQKTKNRIEAFSKNNNIDLSIKVSHVGSEVDIIDDIIYESWNIVSEDMEETFYVMHGDYCLSNILFDFRKNSIKLVDPRGMVEGRGNTIYGHTLYDVGKLAHSIIGGYDCIVSGYYDLFFSGYDFDVDISWPGNIYKIINAFHRIDFGNVKGGDRQVYAAVVLILLSIIPLHSEDIKRQYALLARAVQVYREMREYWI